MPRELEFRLSASDATDNEESAKRDDLKKRSGGLTINEWRDDNGLPLVDTPEADMPFVVAGQSVFMFTPEGIVAAGTSLDESGVQDNEPSATEAPAEPKAEPAQEEVKKFIRWVNRGTATRPFNFEHLDHAYAEVLNKFVEARDLDGARWYAERYLGL